MAMDSSINLRNDIIFKFGAPFNNINNYLKNKYREGLKQMFIYIDK